MRYGVPVPGTFFDVSSELLSFCSREANGYSLDTGLPIHDTIHLAFATGHLTLTIGSRLLCDQGGQNCRRTAGFDEYQAAPSTRRQLSSRWQRVGGCGTSCHMAGEWRNNVSGKRRGLDVPDAGVGADGRLNLRRAHYLDGLLRGVCVAQCQGSMAAWLPLGRDQSGLATAYVWTELCHLEDAV